MVTTNISVPIENFRRVNGWLYRGGQPDITGLTALKEAHIKTVVSLRWQTRPILEESIQVQKLGMNFISIRLNYWSLPAQSLIEQFLSIVDNVENRPIFVHCYHGADRTGLVIAIFRVLRCGWTLENAYREMIECGFHRFRVYHFKWALWRAVRKLLAQNS